MGFVQKRIQQSIGGFGADLRELRELRGYTRERLAKISGIHTAMITALEEEKLQDIADPVYAERHVRTLATELEGRVEFYLNKYRELLAARHLAHAPERALRPRVRPRDLFVASRLVVFVAFCLLVGAIGTYVVIAARDITKAPQLVLVHPTEGEKTTSPHVTVQGSTDAQATVRINGQAILVDESGHFLSNIDVPSGVSTIRIEARRRYSNATMIERHILFERTSTTTTQ